MSLTREQIINYHFSKLVLIENEDEIPQNTCHIIILENVLEGEDYINDDYKQQLHNFVKWFNQGMYEEDLTLDEQLLKFMHEEDEDSYCGNDGINGFLVVSNKLRKMLRLFS